MSNLEVSLTQQEMEESGEMQFIRDHVAAAQAAAAGETAPPANASDTVETEETTDADEVEDVTPDGDTEDVTPDGATDDEGLSDEDADTLYLELDDATQALIDSKYGGDINKALAALPEAQSTIGRQGNEMGALRQELEAFRAQLQADFAAAQPYAQWPDEFADTSEQAAALRVIAEQAFDRRDARMFEQALGAWSEADPVSAGLYRDLKEMQVLQIQREAQAPVNDEALLAEGIQKTVSEIPQLNDSAFVDQVNAELEKTPSLKAVLWGQVPGVSVEERVTILREAAQRVQARTTSETAERARKRIAVRTSEEARAARAQAQVERAATAREQTEETPPRTVPLGETGRTLNLDRLNAMLPEGDRI